MSKTTTDAPATTMTHDLSSPTYQAFVILRTAFTVAPILFGADKFFDYMVNWDSYLARASPRCRRGRPTRRCMPWASSRSSPASSSR